MLDTPTAQQIQAYRDDGFLIVEDLLDNSELARWRRAVDDGVAQHMDRDGRHNQNEPNYYQRVFVQCVNMWKTCPPIKDLVLDRRLGKIATELAGVNGVRLYPVEASS